ncbi:MAG TPA: serine/threonine-protein kinase [Kofleriaceae bacterium]
MICPGCGNALRDDARFCGVCGAATAPGGGTQLTAPPAALGLIGRDIAGRYRILAKLGEGGMGAVYRAEQISLKRQVAVKVLRPEVLGNELLLRRFNAEAEAVAKLSHPNTVNIYDFGQDRDGALFIAMEFIEGQSLRGVLQREPLSPRRALAIAHQVAASLADAHRHGVIHRDLKPDNVMLQDRGRELDVARVLDFGIAKLRDETRATQMQMTQQGDVVGTPQYMAPEQIRGEKVDGRTDIYALGCMLYEMLTGRRPYEAPSVLAMLSKHLIEQAVPPSRLRPELPPQIDALIMAAMAKDPAGRPASMDDVGEQLAQLLASAPPDPRAHRASASASSYPASPASIVGSATQGGHVAPAAPTPIAPSMVAPPAARPGSRRGPVIAIAALLIAAGAGTAIYLAVAPHDEPAPPAPIIPPPAPPVRDPWQTESSISGNKAGIGQGVSLIIPPSYTQTGTKGALTYAVDPIHNRAIFAGPIEPASNDLDELARYHARVNHLTPHGERVQITVGGVGRSLLYFDGVLPNKLAIRQVVLPLIGPGYRVVVIFQALQDQLEHDQATQMEALNVFTQRVVLP